MKSLFLFFFTIFSLFAVAQDDKALLKTKLNDLEKLEKEYEVTKLQWMTQLSLQNTRYKNILVKSKKAIKKKTEVEVYIEVNNYWKELAQSPFNFKNEEDITLEIKTPPKFDEQLFKSNENNPIAKDYFKFQKNLDSKYEKIKEIFSEYQKEKVKSHFDRLVKVAKLRAALFNNISINNLDHYTYKDFFVDIVTEIKVVPYRLFGIFFNRYMFIKEKIAIGFEGYIQLLKEVLLFTFFIVFIVLFKYIIIFVQKRLDRLREYLINLETGAFAKLGAQFLQRIDPYLRAALWWFLFDYFQVSIAKSNLEEVNFFIPYVKYYFVYVMIRIAVAALLTGIVTRKKSFFTSDIKEKISRYSKIISFIFLLTESLLFAVKSTTSQGIIYSFVSGLRFYIYCISFIMVSLRWEDDIRRALAAMSSPAFVAKLKDRLHFRVLSSPAALLLYFYIVLKNKFLMAMNFFNFSSDLSTLLAEKKIQNAEELTDDDIEVNRYYKKLFDLDALEHEEIFIERDDNNCEEIHKDIAGWVCDPNEEHSIAIYGEQGGGKTTLVNYIKKSVADVSHLSMILDDKVTAIEQLYKLLARMFDQDESQFGLSSILKLDKELPKTIVIIDEAHNLFLSKVGGMSAYKEFMKIINLNTENLYWIACFNKYSWRYVDAVFEKPHFFRNVYIVEDWSMREIKDLIIKRHEKSKFDIEYSDIISAIKGEDELDSFTYVESKFFKILTNLSDGNPRLAMSLWLSSLKFNYSKKTITVGLPKVNRSIELAKYNDNTHFVLAELVKHQNLTVRETCDAVNLSVGEVTQTYKVALENHLVQKSKTGRYRLTPNGQYLVINFLKQRNFIYGN